MSRYFQIPFFILAYLSPWGEDTYFRLWRIFIIFYLSPLGAGILSHAMYKNNTTHSYVEGEDINPQRYVTEYRTSYVEYTKTWQLSEDKSGTGQATIFFWYV